MVILATGRLKESEWYLSVNYFHLCQQCNKLYVKATIPFLLCRALALKADGHEFESHSRQQSSSCSIELATAINCELHTPESRELASIANCHATHTNMWINVWGLQ